MGSRHLDCYLQLFGSFWPLATILRLMLQYIWQENLKFILGTEFLETIQKFSGGAHASRSQTVNVEASN